MSDSVTAVIATPAEDVGSEDAGAAKVSGGVEKRDGAPGEAPPGMPLDGMAEPALAAAAGAMSVASAVPAMLLGAGAGLLAPFGQLLAPFGQLLGQFGQGAPARPDAGGVPPGVLAHLAGVDVSTGLSGGPAAAYESDVGALSGRGHALDALQRRLRDTLERSAANTRLGRERIEQVVARVSETITALGPVAATPLGRLGVLTAITQGLTEAGAVLSDAMSADALNADAIADMTGDFVRDSQWRPEVTAGGSGPRAWAVAALAANGITDPRSVARWLPGLMTMGQRESGHDPRAVNNSDSNAERGTPSMGWMQTIAPTFAAHRRPGTSGDIFDPVANAAAAIHYVMTRYGVSPDGSNLMARVQQANPNAAPKGY